MLSEKYQQQILPTVTAKNSETSTMYSDMENQKSNLDNFSVYQQAFQVTVQFYYEE